MIEIVELCDHPEVGPLLARWHAAEWSHLYDEWDEDAARTEFASMSQPGRVPTTYVAFEGRRRDLGAVLGSISIVETDDLAGFEHLTPWLASLYIREDRRGSGVGSLLVAHLVEQARRMSLTRLHLFTAGQEAYYAAKGWEVLARVSVHDEPAAVMALRLDQPIPPT
ncbi:MAG: GNAT family N-acetyltransferase [Ilumatobacteraceae bacterium]